MGWMRHLLIVSGLIVAFSAVGCGGGVGDQAGAMAGGASQQRIALRSPIATPEYLRIVDTKMNSDNGALDIYTEDAAAGTGTIDRAPASIAGSLTGKTKSGRPIGEDLIDMANLDGVVNYATSTFADRRILLVRIYYNGAKDGSGKPKLFAALPIVDQPVTSLESEHVKSDSVPTFSSGGSHIPPPGVRMDSNIRPLATRHEGRDAKVRALLRIANGKLGTRYVWGHNEDRGQYGFDCSNFTEYVYHHALGYSFTSVSRLQYRGVGDRVPNASMRPGDLICFEQGRHVGIYVGNNQMIQCGGGLGRVGYLGIGPGEYWHNRISSVKRMF